MFTLKGRRQQLTCKQNLGGDRAQAYTSLGITSQAYKNLLLSDQSIVHGIHIIVHVKIHVHTFPHKSVSARSPSTYGQCAFVTLFTLLLYTTYIATFLGRAFITQVESAIYVTQTFITFRYSTQTKKKYLCLMIRVNRTHRGLFALAKSLWSL